MAYVVDLNSRKKEYMELILPDEKKTRLLLGTPSKNLLSELTETYSRLEKIDESTADESIFDEVYSVCIKLINSTNKFRTKVTKKQLENCCDIADIFVIFYSYIDFVSHLASQKN